MQDLLRRSTARVPAACVILSLMLAACTDSLPMDAAPDDVAPVARTASFGIPCVASVSAGTVTCGQAQGGAGTASGLIFGGQGVRVNLTSSNVSYDPDTERFEFDVTVQNLMNEAIGVQGAVTLDAGGIPDPDGIRVFFHSQPVATSGNGTITVLDADGTDFFTASSQPFYTYGQILKKDEVSSARTWALGVPPSVGTFAFSVYIETDVEYLLVINEVLANPGGTISDASGEWFEVMNVGTLPVDLQGLVIADSAASGRRPYHFIVGSLVVEPGLSVVFGSTTNTTDNGGVPVDYAYGFALALANSLDAIKISRVFGDDTLTIDRTQYASAAISAQNGISRELKNPALNNANMDGSNWADASVVAVYGPGGRGTPGEQNSTFTPGAVVERRPPLAPAVPRAHPAIRRQ